MSEDHLIRRNFLSRLAMLGGAAVGWRCCRGSRPERTSR